jgi:hypothetical protein
MGTRENRTGIFEMPNEPELPDLFRIALQNLRLSMRTHTIANVVAYNPATQKVTVTVDILQVVKDNITPATPAQPNPVKIQTPITLTDLPVAWPRTSSGYLTFPITPGDKGELHVQDRSLEAWLSLGQATDPVAAWTHNLADSVFHPAIFNDANPITPPTDPTATVLDGTALVKVGRNATEFMVKASTFIALMDAMITAAVAAAAPIVPPAGDGGTAAFTAFQTAWNLAKANIATIKAQGE